MKESFNNTILEKAPEAVVETKEKELSLEEKYAKLEEENNHLKESFSIIGHDLKNQVGSMMMLMDVVSKMLKNESITKEQVANLVEEVSSTSDQTFKLLENLLTWGKLMQEGKKPEILPESLVAEIRESLVPVILMAKNKEINLENKVTEDMNIMANKVMIETVIRNLTSNAIKFTNKGGNIIISSERKGDLVDIIVADDGVGLNENKKQELFKGVVKSMKGTNSESGTGIGLTICKEMVDKMGGAIRAESDGEGKGTRIIVTLPVEK